MREAPPRKIAFFALLAAWAIVAFRAQETLTLRAATAEGCKPSPAVFRVPQGSVAERFRIEELRAGRPCGQGGGATEGFSVRRGSTTVFVYYRDAQGEAVSDPCPLQSLVLEAGGYALYATPATGAAATISYNLQPVTR